MYGELSPKEIRACGGADNTQTILRYNSYGWYEKVRKGVYRITDEGRRALLDYPELEKYYTEMLMNGRE